MAYPVAPARPRRPVSVVVGVAMLLIATAALVVLAVSQFLIVGPVGREIERVTDDPTQEGFGNVFAGVLFGGGGALNAVCAVVLAVLAGFDLAGKRPARIMTWIVAPLTALCCGCASAIYNKYLFGMSGGSASAGQDLTPEQAQAISDGMPDWYTPVALVGAAMLWAGVLGAVIALAVPSANDYFRKPVQTWMPAYGPPPGYPPQSYPPEAYPPQPYPPQSNPPQWPPSGPPTAPPQ